MKTLDEKIDAVVESTANTDKRLNFFEKRMDSFAEIMTRGFTNLQNQILHMRKELTQVHTKVDSIDERLESLERAFDTDSEILVNHEERIVVLEQRTA